MTNEYVAWSSEVTQSMVAHLTDKQLEQLLEELDDAVYHICERYGTTVASVEHEDDGEWV